jgi:hypothetical protein
LPGSAVNGAFLDSNGQTGLIHNSVNSPELGQYIFSIRSGVPLVHASAAFLQANLDGTTTVEPRSVVIGQEPTLTEELVRIVQFRVQAGLTTSATQLANDLVGGLVEDGFVSPQQANQLIANVLQMPMVPPVVTAPASQTSLEGASHLFNLGSFTDPDGAPWSVDVNWGDGTSHTIFSTSSPGTITPQSHAYAEEGPYTVTVKVTDTHDGQSDTKNFGVNVGDQAVVPNGVAVSAKEGIAFAKSVATFTDPGGAELPLDGLYRATISWGDSTPATTGTITFAGGTFTVTGTHAYAEEGTFTITTAINHEGIITTVTSTAAVRDNLGLLVLDPSDDKSLMVDGNGSVTVNHFGAVVVNSNDPKAIFLSGNATVTAAETDVTGDLVSPGPTTLSGELNHEAATPDPIALALPPAPSTTFAAVHYSGSAPLTLSPGTYVGGILIDGSGPVTLTAGVYYMQGGGFTVTGQGSVTGTNVLIVNAPAGASDRITFDAQASVSLTAPSALTGVYAPYNHITIYQDPASNNTVMITGQASLTMTGVLYAPKALLKLDGNGAAVVSTDTPSTGGEVVVFEAMVTGNGALTINADPPDFSVPADVGSASATATASSATVLAPPERYRAGYPAHCASGRQHRLHVGASVPGPERSRRSRQRDRDRHPEPEWPGSAGCHHKGVASAGAGGSLDFRQLLKRRRHGRGRDARCPSGPERSATGADGSDHAAAGRRTFRRAAAPGTRRFLCGQRLGARHKRPS